MEVKNFEPIKVVIEEDYEIPHLNARRKISALLPYDYYESDEHYPVLYLQDGQNLFNPHAPYGDWAIDRSMQYLSSTGYKKLIIIAIDHGEQERIIEYLPTFNPRFGRGKGRFYIQFMKEKLIPYVNRKYRTLTDPTHTGIGGSSMGGLISLYAGLREPEVFGKMMIFSPSLWISRAINTQAYAFNPTESKMYLYSGARESNEHLPNVRKLERILRERINGGIPLDLKVVINEEGQHSEMYWRSEFPNAVKWLFFNE